MVQPCFFFGKHRERPLPDVPTSYLAWALRECKLSTGLRTAVRAELLSRPDCPAALPAQPRPQEVRCHRCGGAELVVYWHQLQGQGGRRIRASCAACHGYIQFLPETPENVALADASTSSTALLDVLTLAEAEGVEIVRREGRIYLEPYHSASPRLRDLVRQSTRLLLAMLPPAEAPSSRT